MPDIAAAEAARAVGYAGIGAVALKAAEFLLKTFGVTKSLQTNELSQTLEAAAAMREELRKDNEDLRRRMREMEKRLEALETQHQAVLTLNERLRIENEDLKARVRLHDARERGRLV